MATSINPKNGFVTRNSQTDEEFTIAQAEARMAARRAPAPESVGTVGQGAGLNQDTTGPFDQAKFADHGYWLAHKDELLAAIARGELPE